jgi:hypothetical protein
MIAIIAIAWLLAIWVVVIFFSIYFNRNVGIHPKDLKVYSSMIEETNIGLVRVHESQRDGIPNGTICEVRNALDERRRVFVEVRGIDKWFLEKYPKFKPRPAATNLESSIFMDARTRHRLGQLIDEKTYSFKIIRAGPVGYMIYLFDSANKYGQFSLLLAIILGFLGLIGYTIKDILTSHVP